MYTVAVAVVASEVHVAGLHHVRSVERNRTTTGQNDWRSVER